MSNNMFLESKSKYGFEETVERLNVAVADARWRVIHSHDLQQTMKNNGHDDVLQTVVMEVCNPNIAHKILSDEASRIYSNMLPCRLSVYKQADGNTYISRMNMKMFAAQLGGKVAEAMSSAFEGAEKIIDNAQ